METIFELLDRLEKCMEESKKMPLTDKSLVETSEIFAIIDELRQVMPAELTYARQLVEQREKFLVQAKQEAKQYMEKAEKEAERLTEESELVLRIKRRSEQIFAEAKTEELRIKEGAHEYAERVLSRVQEEMQKLHVVVDQAKSQLKTPITAEQAVAASDAVE